MNIKLFIATPAFDGKVYLPYAVALAETFALLQKNHINTELSLVNSGSLLCAERNRLIDAFLRSDCTHMLCIDSDLGWPAQAVIAMLQKQEDFICGVYPARGESSFFFRPTLKEDGSVLINPEKGLVSMQYVPAGFMLLTRKILEDTITFHPDLRFEPKDKSSCPGYALFNTELYDGEFWGEDFVFCRKVRMSGFEIWADPMIQFNHAGNIGMLADVLTEKKPEEKNEQLQGNESVQRNEETTG
jgi:hypothetical protein